MDPFEVTVKNVFMDLEFRCRGLSAALGELTWEKSWTWHLA